MTQTRKSIIFRKNIGNLTSGVLKLLTVTSIEFLIETILSTLNFWSIVESIFFHSIRTLTTRIHTMNESCRVENLAVQNRSDPDECNESHNWIKLFMKLDSKVWNIKKYFPFFREPFFSIHITTKILRKLWLFFLSKMSNATLDWNFKKYFSLFQYS